MYFDDQAARLDQDWNAWLRDKSAEKRMTERQTLRTQYRVSDFVMWQREGSLQLNPNFQRRPVWKKGAKSYLIDTILKDFPIPIIFLRDLSADLKTFRTSRDVVDGQQRIRTILSFIDPKLLKDFKPEHDEFTIDKIHNKGLGGKSFEGLLTADKQRILDYQFSVHSFAANTDDREIYQIFARMNSTGVKLNAQELRNAEFFGRFKTLAYSLATEQLNRWRTWKIFTPDQLSRMNEVELTSEFILLIMNGILEKNNKTIGKYYKDFDQSFDQADEVKRRFRKVFETIESSFSAEELRPFSGRTLFYGLFASIYGLQYGMETPAESPAKMAKITPKTILDVVLRHIVAAGNQLKDGKPPARVLKATRGATTHASERRVVIGFLTGEENDPCPALR